MGAPHPSAPLAGMEDPASAGVAEQLSAAEGDRRRRRARPGYRAAFACVSCALLIAFSGRGGGPSGAHRRLSEKSADAAELPCDSYLADKLREDECSIPPNPGEPEFEEEFGGQCTPPESWGDDTFQCMFVDRTSRLIDDPERPDAQMQSSATATFVGGDGTSYGALSFRQKIIPGCGEGGIEAPDVDTGLCEDGSTNARTECILKHKDHCSRQSEFRMWMNSTSDGTKEWKWTKWAIYDYSVPKGGSCYEAQVGHTDQITADRCHSCGQFDEVNKKLTLGKCTDASGALTEETTQAACEAGTGNKWAEPPVEEWELAFSVATDENTHVGSEYCGITESGDTSAPYPCGPHPWPAGDQAGGLNTCEVKEDGQVGHLGEENCWQPYQTWKLGGADVTRSPYHLDLPIDPEATYADGGFIDPLVGKTVVVWGKLDDGQEAMMGCALIRADPREGSCFLATHVVSSYFRSYYCTYGGHSVVLVPFVIWLSYMFLVLGTTADNFFCPALASLSDMIGLTPRVAGVTLLALGNGAPDVFSIYASTKAGEYGIAVGEVTGAANFVCTGVMGICCIITCNKGNDGLKARGMFLRDVLMLIVSTSYLLYILMDAHITTFECGLYVFMYVVYVGMVMVGHKFPPLLAEDRPKWDKQQLEMERLAKVKKLKKANGGVEPTEAELADAGLSAPLLTDDADGEGIPLEERGGEPAANGGGGGGHGHGGGDEKVLNIPDGTGFVEKVKLVMGWYDLSADDRFWVAIQLPVTLIRRLTVPIVITKPEGALAGHPLPLGPDPTLLMALCMCAVLLCAAWLPSREQTVWCVILSCILPSSWSCRSVRHFAFSSPFARTDPAWNIGFNRIIMVLNPPFTMAFLVRFGTRPSSSGSFAGQCLTQTSDATAEDFTATYYYPFGGLWAGQAAMLGFICALPLCYPVWVLTSGPLPNETLVQVYVVFSFVSALFWINVVADELVALLATLGDILHVNHAILGLTVLGCGNSMADLAADMSVTRAGAHTLPPSRIAPAFRSFPTQVSPKWR